MRWLIVLVAACGAEPTSVATVPPQPRAVVTVPAPMVLRVAVPPPEAPAIRAIHGGIITALAVTEDGGAAASIDMFGAMRLWPALDGSREPVVVAAARPVQLAIARAPAGFALAAVDAVGTLEILAVRPTGQIAARVAVRGRPIVAVAATRRGFIAQTDDQALAVVALDGAMRGRLVPMPGEHLVGVAQRGEAALALFADERGVHGRWIDAAAETPTWGAETAVLPIEPVRAVLAPDGTRIAGVSARDRGRIVVVEVATGRVVETFPAADANQDETAVPIAFTDATHLAVMEAHYIRFGTAARFADPAGSDASDVIAAADGAVVWVHGAALGITTRAGTKYLGYQLANPLEVRALEHGFMVSDGMSIVRTDEHFAQRRREVLPDDVWNRIPIDAHRALAMARNSAGDGDLVAVDLDDGSRTTLVAGTTGQIYYQPATRLYASIAHGRVVVGRYAPKTRTFEGPVPIPLSIVAAAPYPSTLLVLPERGDLLSIFEPIGGGRMTITTISAIDFATGSVAISGLGTQPLSEEPSTEPLRTAHGRLVAELDGDRIALREAGVARWVVASHGVGQLVWTPGGDLVGIGNGVARFALATGALAERQCGWDFGLTDAVPQSFPSGVGTLCDD